MNQETIKKRLALEKVSVINQLKKTPIIQISCDKAGVHRSSYYRWRTEDPEFAKDADLAMAEGYAYLTDISEAQLITLIREKNWNAISFYLRANHPLYTNKININATVKDADLMTPERIELMGKFIDVTQVESHEKS